jgi:hypothetical protein
MAKPAEAAIDEAFFGVLSREGFERLPGEVLSYTMAGADGRSRIHVDVEVRGYLSGFGVTLQEITGAATRRQLLEDFRGIQAYRYEATNPESIQEAIAQALADFQRYGMAWLTGQEVSTPATERVRALTAERAYQDLVQVGRERFRAGDYAEAVRVFEEARTVKPLEATDEKYRSIAGKKLKGK